MAELDYSIDALNARGAFFGAKTVIYVEGDDDVLFWQEVFSRVADAKFEIEALGGSALLDEYIQQIASGQLNAIAARDADFLPSLGRCLIDPKVIYTFGYSIENSLYVAETLTHVTRAWCKTTRITQADCAQWLAQLASDFAPLVQVDLANALCDAGVPTMGDNCTRYMSSNASASPCSTKIAAQVAKAATMIPESALQAAAARIGDGNDATLVHLRGHFLASAVVKFVVSKAKALGRKVTVSSDSLYAVALAHFGRALGQRHPHKDHYVGSASAAWAAL